MSNNNKKWLIGLVNQELEKIAFFWIEQLAEDGDLALLQHATKYFQPRHYQALLEERDALNLCGYPPCKHPPNRNGAKKRLIKGKIIDVCEKLAFCSDSCFISSRRFQESLSNEPLSMRIGPLQELTRQIMINGSSASTGGEVGSLEWILYPTKRVPLHSCWKDQENVDLLCESLRQMTLTNSNSSSVVRSGRNGAVERGGIVRGDN